MCGLTQGRYYNARWTAPPSARHPEPCSLLCRRLVEEANRSGAAGSGADVVALALGRANDAVAADALAAAADPGNSRQASS